MFSRGGFDVRTRQRKRPRARQAIDMLVASAKDNPDKALVLKYIGRLVLAGYAELDTLENGDVEARFTSGEIYLLTETTILRLA